MTEGREQILAFADIDVYVDIQWHESLLVDQKGGKYMTWGTTRKPIETPTD